LNTYGFITFFPFPVVREAEGKPVQST